MSEIPNETHGENDKEHRAYIQSITIYDLRIRFVLSCYKTKQLLINYFLLNN